MIKYYISTGGVVSEIEEIIDGCWINVVAPDDDEIEEIIQKLGLDEGFVKAALDDEETSRIESEEDQKLLIIDIPMAEKENNNIIYCTLPLGFVVTEKNIITISLRESSVLKEFTAGMVKNVNIEMKSRFIMQIFFKVATRYLQYLKQIDRLAGNIEKQLHKSMKNKELIQLLDLEKSLVFFTTSLKANHLTMEKILRGRFIKLYEDDQELLEDVLIETKQAIEMSDVYSNILSGTMDAFASIISNNLNIVMKFLAAMTIVMAVPTIVGSIYGMNVTNLPYPTFGFAISVAGVLTLAIVIWLWWRKMF